MCGRYNLRTKLTVLAKQSPFDLDDAFAGGKPRYKIAPTPQVLAVRQPEQGAFQVERLAEILLPSKQDSRASYVRMSDGVHSEERIARTT
jgi:putative SOS response-associated peptidase YedK